MGLGTELIKMREKLLDPFIIIKKIHSTEMVYPRVKE